MFVLACQWAEQSTGSKKEEILTQAITEPIEKRSVNPNMRAKARHILVSYRGALAAPERLRRTEKEARAKALRILDALKDGANFAQKAHQESDDPSKARGGQLKPFSEGEMTPNFEKKVFSMATNELGMVQSLFGFHIVQRQLLDEIEIQSIIIQWNESHNTTTSRSKVEAYERMREVQAHLDSTPFTDLVKTYSDGPYGTRGGMVGFFERGQLNPKIEEQAFALDRDETTNPIELRIGLLMVKRIR